jgi:hypothetical protein
VVPTSHDETGFDNVTLTEQLGNRSIVSGVYWKLIVVLNESTSEPVVWEHTMKPNTEKAGDFRGVVSVSFLIKGTFKMYVVLFSIRDGKTFVADSMSEILRVL